MINKIKNSFILLSFLSLNVWGSDSLLGKRSANEIEHPYGIPTYDALFKYVLDDDTIRPSFFHAVIPDLDIVESTRIDEHMNPLQDFQELRNLIHHSETSKLSDTLKTEDLVICTKKKSRNYVHPQATEFLNKLRPYFNDIKRAFPKLQYDGTMDFVCRMANDEYVLVEMQVIPYDYWDKRALAYVAAFYGRQMKKSDQWKDIKKVIGINILGGGKDRLQHWADKSDQFMRHYKLQEQMHQPSRYIDGIEIIQYSLMNANLENIDNVALRDWTTYFRDASQMTEQEVEDRISTESVKAAFKRGKLSTLPDEVFSRYQIEEGQYSHYSVHTKEQIAKAEEKAEQKAKREMVLNLLKLMVPDETIIQASGLIQTELEALKSEIQ